MADMTPEQRDAENLMDLAGLLDMALESAEIEPPVSDDWADVLAEAVVEAGWRAPGPPTEEEVERAARVKAGPGSRWETLPSVVRGLFLAEAREELTAALGRPE